MKTQSSVSAVTVHCKALNSKSQSVELIWTCFYPLMGFARHYWLYVVDEGHELYGSPIVLVVLPLFFARSVVLRVLFSRQSLLFSRGSYCSTKLARNRRFCFYEIFARKLLFLREATISMRFSHDNHFYFRGFFARQPLFSRDFLAITASVFIIFLWGSFCFREDASLQEWRFREDGSTRMSQQVLVAWMASASALSRECLLFSRETCPLSWGTWFFKKNLFLPRNMPFEEPAFFCKDLSFSTRDPFFHEGHASYFFFRNWPSRDPFFEPVTYFREGNK